MTASIKPDQSSAPSRTARARTFLAMLAIVAAAALLTLHRLGAADVCGVNEAVEGVFLQQMVEHGALLFPVENGRSPMYKPPLFHWTAAATDRLAGMRKVTSFNLRLPAALYAIAGVALTMAFALSFLGPPGAILAGLILCGSYQYVEQGRIGRVDMTLCFCETLALFAFMWWYAPPQRPLPDGLPEGETSASSHETVSPLATNPNNVSAGLSTASKKSTTLKNSLRYLFALALGLGVLAKGPVGALMPVLACGIFLAAERRLADLRKLATPGPLLLAIIVGGCWYAACFFGRRYGFLDRQLGSENFGRFFGTLGAMPPWYYVKPLLLNSAPLSLLVPVAVYFAIRSCRALPSRAAMIPHPLTDSPSSADASESRACTAVRLLAIFWIVTVIFFSLAAYKRRAYLLPLWPASAVMLAWWMETIAARYCTARIARGAMALTWIALAVFNFVYLPRRQIRECGHDSYRGTAAQINRIVGADEPLFSYGLGDEPAPILFYLDRDAPPITGKLGDAPPGYVLVPADVWAQHKNEALDLAPVYQSSSGRRPLVLLRHGKAYALF